jgi:long-chain acyl-CoA synthetase
LIKLLTQEYIEQANAVSRALLRMGIKKMIKSPLFHQQQNRMEYHGYWYLQTAQNVPIYPTITEDDYEYILNLRAIYCFVSDAEILQK